MGMPRYLEDKYIKLVHKKSTGLDKDGNEVYEATQDDFRLFYQTGGYSASAKWENKTKTRDIMRFGFKSIYYPKGFRPMSDWMSRWGKNLAKTRDPYSKDSVNWHYGFEKENGKWVWIYIEAKVNRYFLETAKKEALRRKEAGLKTLEARDEIEKIRTVEQGRTYKGRLRQIIMERDEYKCVLCGKAAKDGVSLEVDHIKAWEDGGRTTYDNGRTACRS